MNAQETYEKKKKQQLKKFICLCCVAVLLLAFGIWMYSSNFEGCRGPNYRGEYWTLTDFIFDPFSFFPGLLIDVGLILLVCFLVWFKFASDSIKSQYENQAEKEKCAQLAQEKQKQRIELLASGQWEFPATDFVQRCQKAGVQDLGSSFYLSKARKIGETILTEQNVAQEYFELYISADHLKTHWQNGSDSLRLAKEEADKILEERFRTPQKGNPNEKELEAIQTAQLALTQTGIEKRHAALLATSRKLNDELCAKREGAKALRELGVILASSVAQEKPKDWATLGGIASGFAGPAAGMATAMNAMAENERIEARNAQNRAAVAKISAEMNISAMDVEDAIIFLSEQSSKVHNEIEALKEKVVLDVPSDELKKALKRTGYQVHKTKSDILEITAQVSNTYVPDVPEGVRITVDGVLVADINCDGIRVGEAYLPLPLYGVACGESAKIKGYCTNHMVGDRKYNISVRNAHVWAMEL